MELFDRIQSPDSILNRVQDKITRVVNAIARKQIIDGLLVESVSIASTETAVPHGLDRVPQGWMLVNGSPYPVEESAPADNKFLYLVASSPTTGRKIWVF